MFSTSNLARCIAALPLLTIASAQYENIEISDVSIVPCPFNIRVDTAPDLSYIDIVYSTKGTTPNSLASYGPKSKPSDNKRRCFTSTTISHPNLTARARPLHMELTGSATLDDGLTAKVETGLTWGYMGAMTNFTTLQLTSSSASPFTRTLNITNRAHAASCEFSQKGSRSDPPTLAQFTEPHLSSYFEISGDGKGSGMLGQEADLKHRIWLEWLEGCGSYRQWYDCVTYDRYDQPSYVNQNAKADPECVDWSRPPPS